MTGSHYSPYVTRPTVLSAVAIFSIIIASISLLVDCGTLAFASAISRFARATVASSTVTISPAPAPTRTQTEYIAPQGLSSIQRQTVIAALEQLRPMSDARQKQVDGLLADVGQQVFQISTDNLTTNRVTAYVTEVRQMPGGNGGEPDDLFMLGSGRLQVSDAEAIFFPSDSPSPIRSNGGSYTDSSGLTHLASGQIAAIVDRVQNLCNHAMNDAQATSLEAELQSPSQTLVTPSASAAQAAGQVVSAQILQDGTLAMTTNSSSMSFGPSGQSYPGIMSASMAGSGWGKPPVVIRKNADYLLIDSMLCFVMAGLLLASGITLLRNAPIARWLHLGYAVGKLLLVVLSCYALYTVGEQLGGSSPDAQSAAMAWMLIVAAPGAIYPLVLLVVMNLKSAREFLSTPTVARIF
jgi:hypothetical protein